MFSVEGLDKNVVCKKKARILMFERIRSKLHCAKKRGQENQGVDGLDENSNVCKNRARIRMISVEGLDKNSNVHRTRSRSPVFRRNT